MSCSRRFVFVCLLWGPWGRFARCVKHLLLGQPPPPGTQTPQSLYSCSATTPNHSASVFPIFNDRHSAAFFRKIFKDFGIHPRLFKGTSLKVSTFLWKIFECFGIPQRLVEETSFTASILPRRSGRSPLQYIYIWACLKSPPSWRHHSYATL